MFDLGWPELFIVAVVAVVVIGPKDLPAAMRTVSHWVRRIRRLSSEFQRSVDDMVRETEIDDIRKKVNQASSFNVKAAVRDTIDPAGEIEAQLDRDPELDAGTPPSAGGAGPAASGSDRAAAPRIETPKRADKPVMAGSADKSVAETPSGDMPRTAEH